jgi:hypothetical protein
MQAIENLQGMRIDAIAGDAVRGARQDHRLDWWVSYGRYQGHGGGVPCVGVQDQLAIYSRKC